LTRSGRVVKLLSWLIDYETNALAKYERKSTDAEERYSEAMKNYQKESCGSRIWGGGGLKQINLMS
jgi:hypothetical protein